MVVIRGERVVLRPFRPEELDQWHRARMASADDRTRFPVGPPDPERLRERVERSGELREGELDLAVEVDGRLIGEIGTYAEPGWTMLPGLFFLSTARFRPEDRVLCRVTDLGAVSRRPGLWIHGTEPRRWLRRYSSSHTPVRSDSSFARATRSRWSGGPSRGKWCGSATSSSDV